MPKRLSSPIFAAIDFETADYGRDSACAVAVTLVKRAAIADRFFSYIRPPRGDFQFTYINGILWYDVKDAPSFSEIWPKIFKKLERADFIAAHNASFDISVMRACCQSSGLDMPSKPFLCTMKLSRNTWNLYPTKLPDVCRYLDIPLNHHEAGSDSEACAKIVMAAIRERKFKECFKR